MEDYVIALIILEGLIVKKLVFLIYSSFNIIKNFYNLNY
jgi:hypothetical protein